MAAGASPRAQRVYVAPGNGGTAVDRQQNVAHDGHEALADLVQSEGIGLTVVGPEAPLASGLVDVFRARGLRVFGPTRAAAQLESSKDFAKAFMRRHGIPTAEYRTFTDAAEARAYVRQHGAPVVVKADGLAAGKGVVVAATIAEAEAAIESMLVANSLGATGARVVVEDFLEGEEASFIVMSDGQHALALATSQDHKRLLDGDLGPNTGGMGAYSPAPVVTPTIHARVLREIIQPTINGMAADGVPYTGFLYAGLMIDPTGCRALEFNCRMGDPETQPIMARLKSDLVSLLEAAVDGRLDQVEAEWDRRTALGVVLAASRLSGSPRRGDVISRLPESRRRLHPVFHSGTTFAGDPQLVTNGGRVLCITALGDTVRAAQTRAAYEPSSRCEFDGMQFRRDIGHRALAPKSNVRMVDG